MTPPPLSSDDLTPPGLPRPARRRLGLPTMILLGALGGLLAVGGLLYMRQVANTNHVALASQPKQVTMVAAVTAPFQPRRRYVGTVAPWIEAKIGPQMVSAYVDTVLVRPGAQVKRGEVLATLDCRSSSATSRAVSAQARALDAMRNAAAKEATRVSSLLDGNYVSENEVDLKRADAASKAAQLAGLQAQMINSSLQVDDCVLRSPFDGEIAEREADPGSFVRPGTAIVSVVDRHMLRIVADVPEDDFDHVAPGNAVRVHLLATNRDLVAKISRRAPAADRDTRTVHIELDLEDPARTIPVWTTAELALDVGAPIPATAIPQTAAAVHGSKVTLFVDSNGTAHATRAVLIGERMGTFYVDPKLAGGSLVVTEGRGLLNDGDAIAGKTRPWTPAEAGAGPR
ncbi:MAG: efflux RND transporter periplasmic adaptor subunit [Kofleriaceae bacterium]